jgi:acyl-CoA synthetase (NDP forming)
MTASRDKIARLMAATQVEEAIEDGVKAGVRSFVVLRSGFSEHDCEGARRQARLTELARRHDIGVVGPNCLGVINAQTGLIASFTTAMEENALTPGGFGFVSQSGALAAYWLDLVLQAGLGVSRWVTTGSECDIDIAASLGMLVEDPQTKVIGAYIEDIKDGPAFRDALRDAASAGKPVFLIKAGRSSVAAAASHTGAIAGEDRVYQACFDQYGAVRVASVSEMIDAAKLALHEAAPVDCRVGVLSVSGGAGVMLADALEGAATAVTTLLARGRQAGVACHGVLIEEMAPFDIELIAGLRRDPVFGAILMVGRGGVEVELSADVAMGLLPLSPDEVAALLRSLRSARLFEGFRGRPPVDVAGVARILSGVGDQFLADPRINEIEIDPLAVRGSSPIALDALISVSA